MPETGAHETGSHFVARTLGLLPFGPEMAATRVRAGTDHRCWLCGGGVTGVGWWRADAFPATFTNVNLAACPTSGTVCQGCAAVSRGESWAIYAARRPDLGLVTKHPISWRSYAHAVWTDHHECPTPARWRVLLTDPPDPPFVFAIPESKQKHLLFRCRTSHDRDRYPVQLEEDALMIPRAGLTSCIVAFEAVLALGCRREETLTGRYHQESIRRAGLREWREAEAHLAPWRRMHPGLMRLAAIAARGPTRATTEETA